MDIFTKNVLFKKSPLGFDRYDKFKVLPNTTFLSYIVGKFGAKFSNFSAENWQKTEKAPLSLSLSFSFSAEIDPNSQLVSSMLLQSVFAKPPTD